MYFDTHTHVNFPEFNDDRDATVQRASDSGTWMINVGTDFQMSKVAVELAQKYPQGVYAAIGAHPTESESFEESDYEALLTDKVVAVGECGLDYFRLTPENRETEIQNQKKEFIKQIEFAKKQGLPLIIHCRDLPATPASGLAWRAGAYP